MSPYEYICKYIELEFKVPCKKYDPTRSDVRVVQVEIAEFRYVENNDSYIRLNNKAISANKYNHILVSGRIFLLVGMDPQEWEYFYNFIDMSRSIFNRELVTKVYELYGRGFTELQCEFTDFRINVDKLRKLEVKNINLEGGNQNAR